MLPLTPISSSTPILLLSPSPRIQLDSSPQLNPFPNSTPKNPNPISTHSEVKERDQVLNQNHAISAVEKKGMVCSRQSGGRKA
mmetsp:Transcript_8283/g.16817  ORF Transcript_8283/g.16817 Transcript_8283/m.16817 type:complete len:83 (-) Transcript_8283:150-398(-)